MGAETYHTLGSILVKKYGNSAVNVGYEGGYAPPLKNTTDALDALTGAIDEAGYGKKISIGLIPQLQSFTRKENTMWMEKHILLMRCRFLC